MKIEIVTKNLHAGGAERVISQLVNFWSEQGHTCKLVLIDKTDKFYELNKSVEVIEIDNKYKHHLFNKIYKYKTVRSITKKCNPDIVLSMPEEIGIFVIIALLFTRVPVIVSERNDPWKMPYKKITRIIRLLSYPFAKGLIFQTSNASMYFPGFIRKKGIVLPNPIDIKRFEGIRHNASVRRYKIISAGRLEKQKNFRLLIDSFICIAYKYPKHILFIYGDGNERARLEQYIKNKKMENRIILPGKTDELLERIAEADLFVLSSDYEGVPNVLIEALSVGTPCVSTNCSPGGAASLITNGKNGYLARVGDVVDLSDKMDKVLSNNAIANHFSIESPKIKQKLDINHVGLLWLKYLQSKKRCINE